MKYCVDCGHYVPGGGDLNYGNIDRKTFVRHVCALQEACIGFIDKENKEYKCKPIDLRRKTKKK